ncbi:chromate transporter [Alicyclobacillus dauci]|uniref:Chromate transporter n=2 Tax=Alicyclobacillus dauci TaxID=1475485 RepID=A0ABY6Z973_9BACL|nr:chromate transporter [Alicyclobacillus dauci]WAH39093.1 chromate transporter [Alicyclobacillus dauci]
MNTSNELQNEPNPLSTGRALTQLVIAMVRTGVVGYGGGPSIIPLVRHEAVVRYRWISDDEFAEILALANTLPGPIATKMAAYLGYRLKGMLGAVIGILAHILPTTLAMVLLLGILMRLSGEKAVKGMIAAVNPVIVAMLAGMTYDFARKSYKGLGKWIALLCGVVAFVLLEIVHVPTAIVVLLYLAYGAGHLFLVSWVRSRMRKTKGDA